MSTIPSAVTLQLDRESLLAAYDHDTALVLELLELFAQDCPARLAAIGDAMAARDPRELQASAHALKGALSAFGVEPVVQTARDLEALGRANDLASADPVFARLRTEVEELVAAFAELRRTM